MHHQGEEQVRPAFRRGCYREVQAERCSRCSIVSRKLLNDGGDDGAKLIAEVEALEAKYSK